jgi:hypothetical protein
MHRPSRYQEVSANSQPNPTGQLDLHGSILGTSILVLPLLIVLGGIFRKRHRASTLRKQVEFLEQLWHINLTRDDCH